MSDDAINLRRIVPSHNFADGVSQIQLVPAIGPGYTPSYTTWANAGDHSITFGKSALGYFAWNTNLFPNFYRGVAVALPQPYVALDRSITLTLLLELLDASGNVLTAVTWLFHEHDTYPAQPPPVTMKANWTSDQTTTLGGEMIPEFNAMRASLSGGPLYPLGSGPASGYFLAASVATTLKYFLQKPVEI